MILKVEYELFDGNGLATLKTARVTGVAKGTEEEVTEIIRNAIADVEGDRNFKILKWVEIL